MQTARMAAMRAVLTGRMRRAAALSRLPIGALALSARGAVGRALGGDPDLIAAATRRRNAERTRRILAELRGGALKAGQLLSTVEALLPADPEASWRRELLSMTHAATSLPAGVAEGVVAAELGPTWRRMLPGWTAVPAAAASIGQVHRARWHDGRQVAVKVQYPGVAQALSADIAVISAMTRVAAALAPDVATAPLVVELATRLREELDYNREAHIQRAFAAGFRDDPDIVVPEVVWATPRVLVSTWLDGTPLARVATDPDAQVRASAARRYQLAIVSGPERTGWLHTDPHVGNFLVVSDGRLGVLDLGSALSLRDGLPRSFGRLLAALRTDDPEVLRAGLVGGGVLAPGSTVDVARLARLLRPFGEPARHDVFHFSRDWLRSTFTGDADDPRTPDIATATALRIPPEHLFTHRVWMGMVGVLCHLDAEVPVREVLERWVPGFADASA